MIGALDGVSLRVIQTIDDLAECQRWAGERRETPLGLDTESTGLNPSKDHCRMVQVGDLRTGWAAPMHGWGGGLIEIISRYHGGLVIHNSSYDNRVLATEGYVPRWADTDDTLIMNHLADSILPAGLKPMAARTIDPRAMEGEKILSEAMAANHWTWATVPIGYPGYTAYASLDPVLACHAWKLRSPDVFRRWRYPYDLERATARICAAMMDAGMMIDVPFVNRTISERLAYEKQAMAWLRSEHGITSVNSNGQLGRALNRAGIPTLAWTPTGSPKMDKETLALYRNAYPEHAALIDCISTCRKTDAVVNRHLRKFLDLADGDSVIHPSINTCRARTSRMSVTDPAMQTFDRDEPVIRGAYVPRPGMVFITVDADQIEARLAAHFSGDQAMIDMFRLADSGGPDFFRLMAGQIFSVDPLTVTKKDLRRQVTKNATYGKIYGSGVETMARTAGVTTEQMYPVHTAFEQLYPGIGTLMQQIIRAARAEHRRGGRPSVMTPTGRRLTGEPGKEYALLNYKIQGHAAEIMKQGLVALDAAGFGPYMRLPIHDEVVLECPREHAEDALATVARILTDRTTYRVPITWAGNILPDRWAKT